MAIINTLYSFGWYGTVENDQPFSLRDNIGTFVWDHNDDERKYTGTFADQMKDTSGNPRDFANGNFGPLKALQIWGYQDGAAKMWSIMDEYHAFLTNDVTLPNGVKIGDKGDPNRGGIHFDTLLPGRMYWIYNLESYEFDLNIPGFIPSADGVDMGRVVPA